MKVANTQWGSSTRSYPSQGNTTSSRAYRMRAFIPTADPTKVVWPLRRTWVTSASNTPHSATRYRPGSIRSSMSRISFRECMYGCGSTRTNHKMYMTAVAAHATQHRAWTAAATPAAVIRIKSQKSLHQSQRGLEAAEGSGL